MAQDLSIKFFWGETLRVSVDESLSNLRNMVTGRSRKCKCESSPALLRTLCLHCHFQVGEWGGHTGGGRKKWGKLSGQARKLGGN